MKLKLCSRYEPSRRRQLSSRQGQQDRLKCRLVLRERLADQARVRLETAPALLHKTVHRASRRTSQDRTAVVHSSLHDHLNSSSRGSKGLQGSPRISSKQVLNSSSNSPKDQPSSSNLVQDSPNSNSSSSSSKSSHPDSRLNQSGRRRVSSLHQHRSVLCSAPHHHK